MHHRDTEDTKDAPEQSIPEAQHNRSTCRQIDDELIVLPNNTSEKGPKYERNAP